MKSKILAFSLCALLCGRAAAQGTSDTLFVAFYNVENLFHPTNDSLTADDDFTPEGSYHWGYKRYFKKINNIAKVLIAMGKGSPPGIVGVAEIENDRVLHDLCRRSPLQKFSYRFVHHDSPDRRGVDVALLYRDSLVTVLHEEAIPVVFPFEPNTRNRDLLYALVRLSCGDSLHIIVNHWTSRFGGYAATIPKRNFYADVARCLVDSLLAHHPHANILLMGDFNDYPTDESMERHLKAHNPLKSATFADDTLFNLMCHFVAQNNVGSHKHEDFWGCLDQIIVTGRMINGQGRLQIANGVPHIFNDSFLLVPDEKYGGVKNYRTYSGPRYIGGFADHLPVYVRIVTSTKRENQ